MINRLSKDSGLNRRTFLKSLGAGTLALSLARLGPWVHAQEPLRLGMANPLATFFGEAAEKALKLGISEINAAGGFLGRPLELVTSDSAGRPDQALRAVQELALSKKADFLTGFFFSEELIGALPSLPAFKKIFLGTGASTPVATIQVAQDYDKYKYFFRVGPVNSFFILILSVQFIGQYLLGKLGWRKIVVMAEDAAWTKAITDNMPILLQASQIPMEVVSTVRYAEDTASFDSIFKSAEQTGADGIFTVMAHTGLRPTLQWAQQQVRLPLVGINVQAQDSRFPELTGGNEESVVTLTSASRAPITEKTIPFVDAFAAFTDVLPEVTIPSYNAFISYDALYILKEAVEAAGVLPDTPANTDAIIQALEATDFVGTTGRLQFYGRDEVVNVLGKDYFFPHDARFGPGLASGVWIQWQSGKQEVLFPEAFATAPFVLPPWLR